MAIRPLPHDSHRYIDKDGTPAKDYYNWAKTITDAVKGLTETAVTFAELPSATANPGARRFVSDATATTFGTVVVGGGANNVPVYSDGANWRIG
jgi:hypothetical protein